LFVVCVWCCFCCNGLWKGLNMVTGLLWCCDCLVALRWKSLFWLWVVRIFLLEGGLWCGFGIFRLLIPPPFSSDFCLSIYRDDDEWNRPLGNSVNWIKGSFCTVCSKRKKKNEIEKRGGGRGMLLSKPSSLIFDFVN
jgi:hypothetical protein